MRKKIITATKAILDDLEVFKKVHKMPTMIDKERSFPVAWVHLKGEYFQDDSVNTVNNFRHATLDITIGIRCDRGQDNLDDLLDKVYAAIKDNYTLSGTVVNSTPVEIVTDEGYLYPYSLGLISYRIMFR